MGEPQTVADMDGDNDYILVTGSFEVQEILSHAGYSHGELTGVGLFVRSEHGEYTDIFSFVGNTAYLHKRLTRRL